MTTTEIQDKCSVLHNELVEFLNRKVKEFVEETGYNPRITLVESNIVRRRTVYDYGVEVRLPDEAGGIL